MPEHAAMRPWDAGWAQSQAFAWSLYVLATTVGCGTLDEGSRLDVLRDAGVQSIHSAIVGGAVVPDGKYPPLGALVAAGDGGATSPLCSGVLVDETHVLTAAHCVVLNSGFALAFEFSTDTARADPTTRVAIALATLYPGFELNPSDPEAPLHDIAVLTLEREVVRSRFSLASAPSPAVGQVVTIVGFGPTTAALLPNTLSNEGSTVVASVTSEEFTLALPPRPQTCFGDSGGPALTTSGGVQTLIGIASRAASDSDTNCTHGAVYTRVDAYRRWIDGVLRSSVPSSGRAGAACSVTSGNAPLRVGDAVLPLALAMALLGRKRHSVRAPVRVGSPSTGPRRDAHLFEVSGNRATLDAGRCSGARAVHDVARCCSGCFRELRRRNCCAPSTRRARCRDRRECSAVLLRQRARIPLLWFLDDPPFARHRLRIQAGL